jgi:hypothetical protein
MIWREILLQLLSHSGDEGVPPHHLSG